MLLGIALRDRPRRAGVEVAGHVDLLDPLRVDRERGVSEVVLAGDHSADDRVERGVLQLDLQAEHLADRLGQLGVPSLDGLAVGGQELVGGIGGVGADEQLAVGGHRRRNHGREGLVLGDSWAPGSTPRRRGPRRIRIQPFPGRGRVRRRPPPRVLSYPSWIPSVVALPHAGFTRESLKRPAQSDESPPAWTAKGSGRTRGASATADYALRPWASRSRQASCRRTSPTSPPSARGSKGPPIGCTST